MAWDLLVNVYKVPKDRMYVTYFGGDDSQGLAPDENCRDIWLNMGYTHTHTHTHTYISWSGDEGFFVVLMLKETSQVEGCMYVCMMWGF